MDAERQGYSDAWAGLRRGLSPAYWRGHALARADQRAGRPRRTTLEDERPTPDQLALWKAQKAVDELRQVVLGHGDRERALRLAAEVLDPQGD
jgi:hypothetical protein